MEHHEWGLCPPESFKQGMKSCRRGMLEPAWRGVTGGEGTCRLELWSGSHQLSMQDGFGKKQKSPWSLCLKWAVFIFIPLVFLGGLLLSLAFLRALSLRTFWTEGKQAHACKGTCRAQRVQSLAATAWRSRRCPTAPTQTRRGDAERGCGSFGWLPLILSFPVSSVIK